MHECAHISNPFADEYRAQFNGIHPNNRIRKWNYVWHSFINSHIHNSQYCTPNTKYQNSWKLLNGWCICNLQWFYHDSIIISFLRCAFIYFSLGQLLTLLPFYIYFCHFFFIICIGCRLQALLNPMQMQFQSKIELSNELYYITKPMELCNMENVMWYPSVNLLDEKKNQKQQRTNTTTLHQLWKKKQLFLHGLHLYGSVFISNSQLRIFHFFRFNIIQKSHNALSQCNANNWKICLDIPK